MGSYYHRENPLDLHIRRRTRAFDYALHVLRVSNEYGYDRVRLTALGKAAANAVTAAVLARRMNPHITYKADIGTEAVRDSNNPLNIKDVPKITIELTIPPYQTKHAIVPSCPTPLSIKPNTPLMEIESSNKS